MVYYSYFAYVNIEENTFFKCFNLDIELFTTISDCISADNMQTLIFSSKYQFTLIDMQYVLMSYNYCTSLLFLIMQNMCCKK